MSTSNPSPFIHRYAKANIAYAKRMRKAPTEVERILWSVLKQFPLNQYRWRRQQPIGPYIVDFYCSVLRLVIEVDGGQHLDALRDKERDSWLINQGFKVLRFWNNDVLTNQEGVLATIQNALNPPPSASTSLTRSVSSSPSRRFAAGGSVSC